MNRSLCRRLHGVAVLLASALVIAFSPARGWAQAQQPALVVEGGTLIDGNGGTPVRDSVVVIVGNKIASVSRKGQASYPPNARVIKADGKFVLPGLFDSQISNSWYFGEALLNHGITSTIDVGTLGELSVPYRDAIMQGKILAPRAFTGISYIVTKAEGRLSTFTGLETPLTPSRAPKSAEDAREMVRQRVAAGADYVIFQDGNQPMEYYRAAVEEARKTGTPVFTRAYGPSMFPKDAALMGSASLPHSAGIPAAIAKTPFNGGRDDRNEADRYADMDDAKAKELIQILVEHKVALVPTFMINFPGYPKDWGQFQAEGRKLFAEPSLLAYYPESAVQTALANYSRGDQGAVRERRMKGYQNALRFHKMFVDAGGHLAVSGNLNVTKAPGLDLHHEMQIFAEAGITPMQIIQGSTKWPAEMVRKQDTLGTVEAGKLADVIIVNEDPLQSIRNLDKIDTVIFNGKVVDTTFHSWYSSPFANVANFSPTVDGLAWVASFKKVLFGEAAEGGGARRPAGAALPDPANAPQPAIETIDPVLVTEGSPTLTLTIKGFNFVRKSTVYFDGTSVPYRVVSPTELQLTVDAGLLRRAGRFDISVKNPQPLDPFYDNGIWGTGTSNKAHLIVSYKN